MKLFGLLALCLTVCWPVASPDVSGGADCDGHAEALKCVSTNGFECPEQGNVWAAGVNPHTNELDKLKADEEFDCQEESQSQNCTGSTYLIDFSSYCDRKTVPNPSTPDPVDEPL